MRLLLVAMAESVHTARFVAQLDVGSCEIHVFSSHPAGFAHPALSGVTVHGFFRARRPAGVRQRGWPVVSRRAAHLAERVVEGLSPGARTAALAKLIDRVHPDVVHTLEIQHAGYLTLAARALVRGRFPPWIVSNWGSDIYRYQSDPCHAARIREVLARCDAYACECQRDVALARAHGFAGLAFPPTPNAGGYDLERARGLRCGRPSSRRLVMLKGYQHWAGRALVGLRALERCADALRGHEVCVYSATPDVAREARALSRRFGIPVEVIEASAGVSHDEILRRHGRARVSVGLSLSDGVSTSFLEALLMGSFPVQSWTACANEWIADGETGRLVPPEDPEEVAAAIRRALQDDALVDAAADRNWATATQRLDASLLTQNARDMYRQVLERARTLGDA
jgi:hypothetical protein